MALPPNITSAKEWGRTLVTMAKYKERRWTYESMLRMSLGGHGEPGFHPQQVCRHVQEVWWQNTGRGFRGVSATIQCAYLEGAGSCIQSRVGMMMM